MACQRAFRPTSLDGQGQLEARVVLSHSGIVTLAMTPFHAGGHHPAVAHHVVKGHGHVILHRPGKPTNVGLRALAVPTGPVGFVPNANPPASTPPVATPPVATPPPTSTPDPGPATTTTTPAVPSVSGVMSSQEQTIVDLVNQQRQQAGLAPLQVDSRLVAAAQIHSSDMAQLGQMEHVLPGAALPAPTDRAGYVGYNYSWLGENIAFNYPDDNSVMAGWMNSPDHRANILNPNFTQIGVGIAYDSTGEPYYTQEFGSPA